MSRRSPKYCALNRLDPMAEPNWRRYLRFWRPSIEADLDDELRFHLEERVEALVAGGITTEAARRAAEAEFGDLEAVRRRLREIDSRVQMAHHRADRWERWREDFAYSARSLRRAPGLAATVIITLALGIGLNATLFSLLDRLFLQMPSGITSPHRVERLYWSSGDWKDSSPIAYFSIPMVDAMRDALKGVARVATYQRDGALLGGGQESTRVGVTYVGPQYFSVLGVHPAFGRFFSAEEERIEVSSPVAVVSDVFWRSHFSASPADAIGQKIILAKREVTIVGVAPRAFTGADLDATDVWVPLGMVARMSPIGQEQNGSPWYRWRWLYGFQVLARPVRATEVRLEAVAMVAAQRSFREESAEHTETRNIRVFTGPLIAARGPALREQEASIAIRLGGVAVIVLLIACANVANLLLARSIRRRREVAIRSALGIARFAIMRLFLAESVLLAIGAGIAALVIASWAGSLLRRLLFPSTHWVGGVIDWRLGAFTAVVTLLTGVAAGLTAAIRASRTDPAQALKSGGREGSVYGSRVRATLVVAQTALSTILLVGAGLFVKSLHAVRALDLGYDVQKLVFVSVHFDAGDARAHAAALETGIPELAARLARLPGVERVALSSMSPMYGFSFSTVLYANGDTLPRWSDGVPNVTAVSPDYFATIGLPLVLGRNFVAGDARDGSVVIVNRTLARTSWPHGEAIGQCVRIDKPSAPCLRVIGVVEDARRASIIEDKPVRQVYLPATRTGEHSAAYVIVRVPPEQAGHVEIVAGQEVQRTLPNAEAEVVRMADLLAPQYRPWKLGASLFSVFGLLALVVAAIGVFSTLSHEVGQRRHEMGVRAALGASLGNIIGLVLGRGIRVVLTGAMLGVLLALIIGRLVASLLYGVRPNDPPVFLVVSAMLITVAALASVLPAWRASRADPLDALRAD